MHLLASGPARHVRAVGLGLAAGALTIGGHTLGHGGVSLVAVMIVMGLAVAGAGALTSARLGLARLIGFVVVFEVAGHWLLTRLTAAVHGGTAAGDHTHAAATAAITTAPAHSHAIGDVAASRLPRVNVDVAGLSADGLLPHLDIVMVSGHVLAAALIILLAWRADAALHAFEAALHRAIEVVLGPGFRPRPHLPSRPAAHRWPTGDPSPAQRLWIPPVWRLRGPPAPCPTA